MTAILNRKEVGAVQVFPGSVALQTTDSYATITAAGYLSQNITGGFALYANDIIYACYGTNSATVGLFGISFDSNNVPTMAPTINTNVTLPTVANTLPVFSNTTGGITSNIAATNTVTNTSATPGTVRALVGAMSSSATTQTSGNLVGVRGSVTMVGASGGFIYGAQGKVIATGTFTGSVWVAGLFGQFDISAATVNAAQFAAIWGDWGTTGATATDLTGCRGVAFTNTTSNVLNAQDYRYGNATYLLELAGAGGTLNYYAAAGTASGSAGNSTHCAAQQVIKVVINGTAAYIPVFTQNT